MKIKSAFILVVLNVVLAISLLVVTCAEAAPEAMEVLKIGNTEPLQIREGLEQQRWLKLFAKLINEEGGWMIGGQRYKIEWIFYNNEYSAEKGRAAAERLVFRDNVKYIINQWGTTPTLASMKVTEPNKVLNVSTTLSDEPCKPEYKYTFKGVGPIPAGTAASAISAEEYVKRGMKTVVTMNPDDATGHARNEQDKRMLPRMGLQILDNLFYARGIVDFGPLATKAKSLDPDLVWYGATAGPDLTKLTVALHDVGYKGGLDCDNLHAGVISDIIAKIGPEYIDGMVSPQYDARLYQEDPEMVKYLKAYEKEYGVFNVEGVLWIGNWFVFKSAVEATQSLDVDVLTNYLANDPPPVKTLCGWQKSIARPDLDNLRTTDSVNSIMMGIMKNGKLVPLRPITLAYIYKTFVEAYGMQDIYSKYWQKYGYPKFPKED